MQGFPLEGYKPLPPNSPEDTFCEEVENYSDTGSVATPLIEHPEGEIIVYFRKVLSFLQTRH
jgi:hypothetical protein